VSSFCNPKATSSAESETLILDLDFWTSDLSPSAKALTATDQRSSNSRDQMSDIREVILLKNPENASTKLRWTENLQ
jgi:hypothetical protein